MSMVIISMTALAVLSLPELLYGIIIGELTIFDLCRMRRVSKVIGPAVALAMDKYGHTCRNYITITDGITLVSRFELSAESHTITKLYRTENIMQYALSGMVDASGTGLSLLTGRARSMDVIVAFAVVGGMVKACATYYSKLNKSGSGTHARYNCLTVIGLCVSLLAMIKCVLLEGKQLTCDGYVINAVKLDAIRKYAKRRNRRRDSWKLSPSAVLSSKYVRELLFFLHPARKCRKIIIVF